jgi:hypothetical protein
MSQSQSPNPTPMMLTIERIRSRYQRRTSWHKAEKTLTLQGKATCRRLCDGDKEEGTKLYEAIAKYTDPMLEQVLIHGHDDPRIAAAVPDVLPLLKSRAVLVKARDEIEREIEHMVLDLPVTEWATKISGVGVGSVSAIIGHAGNLWHYPTVRKLWKRLGLGVADDGLRQRNLVGLTEEERLRGGYNAERRSAVWNIGTAIMFAQTARIDKTTGEVKRNAGEWRKIYDARRAYEEEKNERGDYADLAAKILSTRQIGKKTESYKAYSQGKLPKAHLKNRAQRFMEKQFIKQLWLEWRKTMGAAKPSDAEIKERSELKMPVPTTKAKTGSDRKLIIREETASENHIAE